MDLKKRSPKKRRPVRSAEALHILALRSQGKTVHQISVETKRAKSTIFRVIANAAKSTSSLIVVSKQEEVRVEPTFAQRMVIKLCRFFGVTDTMYKHN